MTEQPSSSTIPWDRVLSVGANIVAPATAISALLFYFGYVSTRAQYLYFGLDVDTIGLSTQGFVMRSPQPLLVPVLTLTLLVGGVVVAARRLRPRLLAIAGRGVRIGTLLLVVGFALLVSYPALDDWEIYGLITPLVLGIGAAVTAYTLGLRQAPISGRAALWVTVVAAVFWANATVAQWSGRGLAQQQAGRLESLPQVVVDTRERLYLRSPDIAESELPPAEGQTFGYRYRGLRLLVQNGDRMFLVACHAQDDACVWRPPGPTLMLRTGDSVRVQFFAP